MIVAAGQSDNGNSLTGKANFALARYTSNGTLDTSFGTSGKTITDIGTNTVDLPWSLLQQPDGGLVVSGVNGLNDTIQVARFSSNGTLDTSFGTSGKFTHSALASADNIYAGALQTDGKIVLGGSGNGDFLLLRLTSAGALDTSFNTTGFNTVSFSARYNVVRSQKVLADGKILAAGYQNCPADESVSDLYNSDNTGATFAIARFNTDGTLDTSFGSSGKVSGPAVGTCGDIAYSAAFQSDGKIVLGGYSCNNPGSDTFTLQRYTASGALDTSFNETGTATTTFSPAQDAVGRAITLQPDGKIVTAGQYLSGGTKWLVGVTRHNSDGTLDTGFNAGKFSLAVGTHNDVAYGVTVQADGRIVVSGWSDNGSTDDFFLFRLWQ
jgi:uncharacterized delta-60 repeat protein